MQEYNIFAVNALRDYSFSLSHGHAIHSNLVSINQTDGKFYTNRISKFVCSRKNVIHILNSIFVQQIIVIKGSCKVADVSMRLINCVYYIKVIPSTFIVEKVIVGCALMIARRGETTPLGVWHQQYTHNHVWSLNYIYICIYIYMYTYI